MKKTEIEVRGKANKSEFDRSFRLLKKNSKLIDYHKRLSVDLSPGFDQKTRTWKSDNQIDLRIKKTGSLEKLSLKIGKIHAKKRQEIDINLNEGEFLNSITLFNELGFERGMIYFWESWAFKYKGCEIKLSRYTNDYFTWEVESLGKADPETVARELNLKPYTKNEYQNSVNWENQNIHKLYSYNLAKKLLKKIFT